MLGLGLQCVGRRQVLRGAGGAVLLEAAQPSPRRASCASALFSSVFDLRPSLVQRQSKYLPRAMQKWLVPRPGQSLPRASPSGFLWCSGELGLSSNCELCFNQRPCSPACGSCGWHPVPGAILDFKHIKKLKGQINSQNCEAQILHGAGFPCENPKAVPVCSQSEHLLWAFQMWQSPACSNLFWFSPGFSMPFGNFCAGCSWDRVLRLLCITHTMWSNWKPAQLFVWRQLHKTAGAH